MVRRTQRQRGLRWVINGSVASALLLSGLVASSALADPPESGSVEIWYGPRRIYPPERAREPAKPTAPAVPPPSNTASEAQAASTRPSAPGVLPHSVQAQAKDMAASPPANFIVELAPIDGSTGTAVPVPRGVIILGQYLVPNNHENSSRPGNAGEAVTDTSTAERKAPASTRTPAVENTSDTEASRWFGLDGPVALVIGVTTGAIVGPLVLLAGLSLLLRRGLRGKGPLLRIEYVGQPMEEPVGTTYGPASYPVPPSPLATLPPGTPLAEAAREEPAGEYFVRGPTYGQELQMRDAKAIQQQDAVLQHLFGTEPPGDEAPAGA
jgi:hypothetical protein